MKPAGTGRIVIWRGGSLWIGHAGEPTETHAHHAVQISLPLSGGRIRFRRPGGSWTPYDAAIVAAHQPHAFEAGGEFVAMLFVEPESRQGRALQQRCSGAGIVSPVKGLLEKDSAALAAAYERTAPDAELAECARTAIARLAAASGVSAAPLDRRIERALARLRERIGGPVLLSEIAEAAFLSPDRFRHLFVEETGVRFRPYVLWLRIEVAVAALAAGGSLTDASHAAGFADSAHFSRTFKRMFGIAPSSFLHD